MGLGNTKHGLAGSSEHNTWRTLKQRCLNKKNKQYSEYGGRGITICESWLKFENFFLDMGIRPNGLSLERIDNNKGYSKDNCKWATRSEQQLNQRPRGKVKIKGVYIFGKKYRAIITIYGKTHHIGMFDTPELAGLAYESCKYVLDNSTEVTNENSFRN